MIYQRFSKFFLKKKKNTILLFDLYIFFFKKINNNYIFNTFSCLFWYNLLYQINKKEVFKNMKKIFDILLEKSLLIDLLIFNFIIIFLIYKSYLLFFMQFSIIIFFIYISIKIYEKYIQKTNNSDYKFNNDFRSKYVLEKFFITLLLVSIIISLNIDINNII